MAVAGEYRCPVCAGESVAASDAPEAVEIKGLVQQWLAEGRSQGQIRSYLVKDYGTSILERPPTSGLSVLVWALPGVAVAAGLIGLGLGFARWRRANLVVVGPAGAGVPHRWSGRVSLVAGTALVVIAGTLWLLDRSATPRLPGDTITGGQNGTSAALQQASALAATDPAAALAVYDAVLATQPDQPEALTDEGWIYAQSGFVDEAMARLDRAEKVDPAYDAVHLYRALVLLDDEKRPAPAATELKWYLAHGPASALVAAARAALVQAESED
jgi:tetratricopeptide (TPR) repeat protein